MVHMFASQGVDPDTLLRDAGLDPDCLKHAHERIPLDAVDRMWALAVERSRQETLGLDRAVARRHIDFNISAQAMWSSPDLASGLKVLAQYLELIHDAAQFELAADRGDRWLVLEHGTASPRQRVEYLMFGLVLLCQQVTRHPQLHPQVVEFTFPEPSALHAYRMAFHCPLRFGQGKNRMKLSHDELALPVQGEGESLFAIQDHVIEARLAKSGRGVTIYRASEEIIRNLHLGEPQPGELARKLGMTDAVFERRLRSEGNTTFEQVLDGVRRELAEQYLKQPGYTAARVANLLGWETTAPLTAACKRWFGVNITEFRHTGAGMLNP